MERAAGPVLLSLQVSGKLENVQHLSFQVTLVPLVQNWLTILPAYQLEKASNKTFNSSKNQNFTIITLCVCSSAHGGQVTISVMFPLFLETGSLTEPGAHQ